MLFRQRFLDGIRDGTITLAYRRWRRPTVRAGGTLLTAIGQLEIASVVPVDLDRISAADARRAGYASLAALRDELLARPEGTIYRIDLGAVRPDPRVALRGAAPGTADEQRDLIARLDRLDARSPDGPWTRRVLALIAARPAVRAGDLCVQLGQEKQQFKENVRKLKALGLTESLEVGYRLSPRGRSVLAP
jgi:hypothetical protein